MRVIGRDDNSTSTSSTSNSAAIGAAATPSPTDLKWSPPGAASDRTRAGMGGVWPFMMEGATAERSCRCVLLWVVFESVCCFPLVIFCPRYLRNLRANDGHHPVKF